MKVYLVFLFNKNKIEANNANTPHGKIWEIKFCISGLKEPKYNKNGISAENNDDVQLLSSPLYFLSKSCT